MKAAEDHLASIQLQTSKPDVYIKLQILDQEEELLSAVGKGHAVLPAIIIKKDPEDPNRAGSRACEYRTISRLCTSRTSLN